jgi:hypothetical protein
MIGCRVGRTVRSARPRYHWQKISPQFEVNMLKFTFSTRMVALESLSAEARYIVGVETDEILAGRCLALILASRGCFPISSVIGAVQFCAKSKSPS